MSFFLYRLLKLFTNVQFKIYFLWSFKRDLMLSQLFKKRAILKSIPCRSLSGMGLGKSNSLKVNVDHFSSAPHPHLPLPLSLALFPEWHSPVRSQKPSTFRPKSGARGGHERDNTMTCFLSEQYSRDSLDQLLASCLCRLLWHIGLGYVIVHG